MICLTGCSKVREVAVGGSIQVTGSDMNSVAYVSFPGKKANLRVKPDLTTKSRIEATVPEGAVSGRIRVISSTNAASSPAKQTLTVNSESFSRAGKLTVTDASTSPRKAYQYGMRLPALNFVINGAKPKVDLRVDIVNTSGDVVRSRFLSDVETGTSQKVAWSGTVAKGKLAPNGTYRFVVRGNDGTPASLSTQLKRQRIKARAHKSAVTDPFSFRMYRFIFPLRGSHTYGDGIGAARSGHTHQGVDVLANCGLPLVAARAGTVYWNSYDAGGAGNYIVINTKGNGGKSQVYMHMSARSPLKKGAKVKTGQRIGTVGTTGSSSACHLHFEIWSSPGWYQGGTFLDPMPSLKAWDRYS